MEGRHPLSAQPLAANPATANAAFVESAYQDVLGRQADPAALAWGTSLVNSGQPRSVFAGQLVDSQEADTDFIDTLYQHYLGRKPDQQGLGYWVDEMRAGATNQQIEAAFLANQEFYSRAGSDQPEWIQAVYRAVLGRGAENQAVNWAESQLQSGERRYDVASAVVSSKEATAETIEQDLSPLHVPIDPILLQIQAAQLAARQTTEQQLEVAFLASPQYFDTVTGVPVTTVRVPNVTPIAAARDAEIAAKAAVENPNVVFVGDSITQLWETEGVSAWNQYFAPLNSFNAGVGGDTTSNVLWRLENGNLNGTAPNLAVLMIGTNDLYAGANDTAAGITAVVEQLQKEFPGIRILLLGVLPALQPAAGSPTQQMVAQVNQLIRPLADGQHVWFLDVDSSFLNPDGSMDTSLFQSDDVHPNAEGFEVLAQAIAPWVKALA